MDIPFKLNTSIREKHDFTFCKIRNRFSLFPLHPYYSNLFYYHLISSRTGIICTWLGRRMNLNEMKRKAKKLYSFRGPKSWRTPRAKSALYSKIRFCRPPRGLFLRSLSPFFPSLPVQKGNLTRPLADKRNPIPCFICLYRRSYPLDRRIIGKTDNNETRDITVNELQLLIADDFREFEFMLYTQKGYIGIEYDYELKYLF